MMFFLQIVSRGRDYQNKIKKILVTVAPTYNKKLIIF